MTPPESIPSLAASAFAAALARRLPGRVVVVFAQRDGVSCGVATQQVADDPVDALDRVVARFRRIRPEATMAAACYPSCPWPTAAAFVFRRARAHVARHGVELVELVAIEPEAR